MYNFHQRVMSLRILCSVQLNDAAPMHSPCTEFRFLPIISLTSSTYTKQKLIFVSHILSVSQTTLRAEPIEAFLSKNAP
jgi:hypothetical protein